MTVTSASDFMKSFDDCTQSVDIMDKKVKDQILEVIQKYRSGTGKRRIFFLPFVASSVRNTLVTEFFYRNLFFTINGISIQIFENP